MTISHMIKCDYNYSHDIPEYDTHTHQDVFVDAYPESTAWLNNDGVK